MARTAAETPRGRLLALVVLLACTPEAKAVIESYGYGVE